MLRSYSCVAVVPVHRIDLDLGHVHMIVPARSDRMMIRINRAHVFCSNCEPSGIRTLFIQQAPDIRLCSPSRHNEFQMFLDSLALRMVVLSIAISHVREQWRARVFCKRKTPHRHAGSTERIKDPIEKKHVLFGIDVSYWSTRVTVEALFYPPGAIAIAPAKDVEASVAVITHIFLKRPIELSAVCFVVCGEVQLVVQAVPDAETRKK
eukprot:SAG11_NODE_810_length_7068_cov_2.906443_2_plen_208_part_00